MDTEFHTFIMKVFLEATKQRFNIRNEAAVISKKK